MSEGALSGLTILELGEMISAPYCTKLMADLGAEVIKIEPPLRGDSARQVGPFPEDIPHQEKSGLFLYLNANKIGITLDPGDPEGLQILHRLVQKADVLVHNLSPQRAEELHLSYDSLKALNAGIVVCAVTLFGMTGPYRNFKGTPLTTCHISGAASAVGQPEREPLALPEDRSAYFAAVTAAGAILCALFARELDGLGQDVDIAEADALAGLLMGGTVGRAFLSGEPTPRTGHRMGVVCLNAILPCRDGYVALIAFEDDQFQRLLEVMGNPEWGREEIFRTRESRRTVAEALEQLIIPWLKEHTREEVFRLFQGNRVPAAPLYTAEEIVHHPHLMERGFFREVEHPVAGRLKYAGAPYIFSESPWELRRPAPVLGEHSHEVYCDRLGLSAEDCSRLRNRGVI